jgi:TolA-binding protein
VSDRSRDRLTDRLPPAALAGLCIDYLTAVVAVNAAPTDSDPVKALKSASNALMAAHRSLSASLSDGSVGEESSDTFSPLYPIRRSGFEKDRRHLPELWLKLYESVLPKIEPWTARKLLRQEIARSPFPQVVDFCRSQLEGIIRQLVSQLEQQGEKAIQDKRYPDAQAAFRKLIAEFPDEHEPVALARVRLHEVGLTILKSDKSTADLLAYADRKLRFRKHAEAETLYRKVYEANRSLEGAESLLLKVAESQKEHKEYDASLKSLNELLAAHPDSPVADDALYDKAVLLGCQLKKREEGIALLRRLLNQESNSDRAADAQYILGYLCLTVDDKEGAREAFSTLTAKYATSPRAQWAKKDMEALSR